ncbi:DgyrCDS2803 [Dimorphilus gyrociliatus]|uniref:DgyrCDS2803 n=1 Tax=Dimorphilus gyrociliatus TaxID=2664684 RepID=A0A7I8VE32_9ANNE|nr:DgyrCDS2803 [Dimorphilus gyrociliatus]
MLPFLLLFSLGFSETLRLHVNEETPIGFRLLELEKNKSYRLLTDTDLFRLSQGVVYVNNRIDRETLCKPGPVCATQLEFAVLPIEKLEILRINITIDDINDNPPIVKPEIVRIKITESTPLDALFPIASVKDADGEDYGIKTVQLEDSYFGVVHESDELRLILKRMIDYERLDNTIMNMSISISDGYYNTSLSIIAEIIDINDNPPIFEKEEYIIDIYENLTINTQILNLKAVDLDSTIQFRLVKYSLSTNQYFGVDAYNGTLKTLKKLNYEAKRLFHLTATATDAGGLYSRTSIIIRLLNINERSFRIKVTPITGYDNELLIKENLLANSVVALVKVELDEWEESVNNVECFSDESEKFKVSRLDNQLVLLTNTSFDREFEERFSSRVICVNLGVYRNQSIDVRIVDENDNAPEFVQSEWIVEVEENIPPATLIAISATDSDKGLNSELRYEIYGEDCFQIHPIFGTLSSTCEFDFEVRTVYNLTVHVFDGGEPSLNNSVGVKVIVKNLLDTQPECLDNEFRVLENEGGVYLGQISFRNPENSTVFFSKYDEKRFSISNESVFLREPIDRERLQTVNLRPLILYDLDPRVNSTCQLVINIVDLNDNVPEIVFPSNDSTLHLPESSFNRNRKLLSIVIRDDDEGLNGEIDVFLKPEICFRLDGLDVVFDCSTSNIGDVFNLELFASDKGTPALNTSVTFKIIRIEDAEEKENYLPFILTVTLSAILLGSLIIILVRTIKIQRKKVIIS